jgi:hypothetical protein
LCARAGDGNLLAMPSSATAYDYEIRVLECPECGRPITSKLTGEKVLCKLCATETTIAPRAPAPPAKADAAAVVDQAAPNAPRSPYSMPALPSALGALFRSAPNRRGWGEVKKAWTTARHEWSRSNNTDDQTIYWLARWQWRGRRWLQRKDMTLRALLETAYEMVQDPNYRHLIACLLVQSAAQVEDLAAAEAWLRHCDAHSGDRVLDTQYKDAVGAVLLAKKDYDGVLSLVGSRHGDVSLDPEDGCAVHLRVHALEMLGRDKEAYEELDGAPNVDAVVDWLRSTRRAPRALKRWRTSAARLVVGLALVIVAVVVWFTLRK